MKNNKIISKQEKKCLSVLLLLLFVHIHNIDAQSEPNEPSIWDKRIELDTILTISPLTVEPFRIDTAFSNRIYKENFKLIPSKVNIYDMPYSIKDNYPNYRRLALNTGVLYAGGLLALGVLYILPEDATAWNKKEMMEDPPFRRWWNNVKKGPVWDGDNAIFNYVLHPYAGAAYYMGARSQGFNLYYSFLYVTGISTIFWEYGIEAFMEIPSIQDLFVTPLAGTVLGESFYLLKRHIVANDYTLWGSSFMGNVVAYLIDPVNEVIGIFAGNPCRQNRNPAAPSLACTPWLNTLTKSNGKTFGFTMSLSF